MPEQVDFAMHPMSPIERAMADGFRAGCPPYFLPLLARAGHLKPLGKPGQNARKWYAMVELERLSRDPLWLDKAIRLVDRLVREANGKSKGKGSEEALAA